MRVLAFLVIAAWVVLLVYGIGWCGATPNRDADHSPPGSF